MKAIILASGRGTRMKPLTNTVPKPMIPIAGKPMIEHNIEKIYESVDEIILVVKYLKEQFIEFFGDNYQGTPIRYFEQWDGKGTAAALWNIETEDDVVVLYGDSIFEQRDLDAILQMQWYGCLVKQVDDPKKYGIFLQQVDGTAMKVIEKPTDDYGNLANVGVYKFSADIFSLAGQVKKSPRGEYELTDAVNFFCSWNAFQLIEMQWDFIDVWYPWQILSANTYFLSQLEESKIEWTIEENVSIHGKIILEKWAVLKSGTYIEWNCIFWENTVIGPNAYIRGNSVFGKWAKAGNAVEVKNSSIGNNSSIAHLSYIWDSIIGNHVNIWWGLITANLRHDGKNMRCMVQWELVDTWLRKLGVIMGDNIHTGIHTSIYPGRIIDTVGTTLPWEIIK